MKNLSRKQYLFIVISALSIIVLLFLQCMPRFFVELAHPEYKSWEAQLQGTYRTEVKLGFPDSYVVYSKNFCSGLYCPEIVCYKVTLGYPTYIGRDSGSSGDKPEIDYQTCTYVNKMKAT